VFLSDPLPNDLPVVEACKECNQGFSLDEEYVACLIECSLHGSTAPECHQHAKVKRILMEKPSLASLLNECRTMTENGTMVWIPDEARVRNVLHKLARGHAAFELSLPQLEEPVRTQAIPFVCMTQSERDEFEEVQSGEILAWPEVGSRAFLRVCGAKPFADQNGPWICVQENRYRYAVDQQGGVLVRMVIAEYLGCEVEWD
jgi:hypothetical protein